MRRAGNPRVYFAHWLASVERVSTYTWLANLEWFCFVSEGAITTRGLLNLIGSLIGIGLLN